MRPLVAAAATLLLAGCIPALRRVRIEANLGSEERPRYVVTFPPYDFDGVRYEMKPLDLERRTFDVGLEPFNC